MSQMVLFMIVPQGARSTRDIPASYQPPSLGNRDSILALLKQLDPQLDESHIERVHLPTTGDAFDVRAGDITVISVRNPSDELMNFIWSNTNWAIIHAEKGIILLPEPDEDDVS